VTDFSPRAFRRSLRGAGITATEYRVAVELCEYAGPQKPVVWPSIAVLAEDCELGRSTVIRVLGQLESKGFIACDGGRKGGRGCSTRWRPIVKGLAAETLSDGKRVPLQTKRVPLQTEKGPAGGTRRRKEEGEEGGAADAAHPPLSFHEMANQKIAVPSTSQTASKSATPASARGTSMSAGNPDTRNRGPSTSRGCCTASPRSGWPMDRPGSASAATR